MLGSLVVPVGHAVPLGVEVSLVLLNPSLAVVAIIRADVFTFEVPPRGYVSVAV
jgi:hypothetical protein